MGERLNDESALEVSIDFSGVWAEKLRVCAEQAGITVDEVALGMMTVGRFILEEMEKGNDFRTTHKPLGSSRVYYPYDFAQTALEFRPLIPFALAQRNVK